jgi:hypothetical protein
VAYDEDLAARVRELLAERLAPAPPPVETRMFGGLAFMVNTHMAVGVAGDGLLVPVGPGGDEAAFARGAEPMRMGERTMSGWVRVPGHRVADNGDLASWVGHGVELALAKPPKPPKR